MSLPLVIVNPASAGGSTRNAWLGIASDLRSQFGSFNSIVTETPGQATELAAGAARKGVNLIVACGGDGTVSEVANGILASGKDAELGIIPSGTGGDFRRTLEIPTRARDAARILREGRTRPIDVGRVSFLNNDGEPDTRYFLGVASFGMSAEVIERVKEGGPEWLPSKAPRWLTGRVAFGVSMLQTAVRSRGTRVVLQLDDQHEVQLTAVNVCIANARYFGGGMKIAPAASLADGKFDVITIGDVSALKMVTNAPRLYLGAHMGMQEVSHTLAQKLSVRPVDKNAEVRLEVDGELPGRLPATFQILHKALRVRCPR